MAIRGDVVGELDVRFNNKLLEFNAAEGILITVSKASGRVIERQNTSFLRNSAGNNRYMNGTLYIVYLNGISNRIIFINNRVIFD